MIRLFKPGTRVKYANVRNAKAGLGPHGMSDRRPVRATGTVIAQGLYGGPRNVLIQLDTGRCLVTTWPHVSRIGRRP